MDSLAYSVGSGQRSLRGGRRSLALAQMVQAVVDQQARSLAKCRNFFRNFAFFAVFNSNL
jgi:hypothetical protein